MDAITTAIVAAVSAGTASGLTQTSKNAIDDAYHALKSILAKKCGTRSEVMKAVKSLEDEKDFDNGPKNLQKKIAGSPIMQDSDVLEAAQQVLTRFEANPGQFMTQNFGRVYAQNYGSHKMAGGCMSYRGNSCNRIKLSA